MDTSAQREHWLGAIAAAADAAALAEVDARLFGPKGEVLELVRSVTSLPKEQRPAFGKAANALKQEVEQALAARRDTFVQAALAAELAADDFDPTEPGPRLRRGALHPITIVQNELVDLFTSMGFQWDAMYYAADYFGQIYAWAEQLVQKGLAYVDDQTAEQIAATRGTVTAPGQNSPHRDRSPAENLELLRAMKAGKFPDGSKVLRAKIDMAHSNLNLRDPVMYRIRHLHHQRTGDAWCIYPMYDWAHGQCDSIEGITHSLCTLEFEQHRPLYDWFCDSLGIYKPQQIEFARLNVEYLLTSKRRLLQLVEGKHVRGWDDPRMPTLRGLRRRGYPPEALVAFCKHVGVAKFNSTHEIGLLEFHVRDHLNKTAQRRLAVLDPLKVVIENWPGGPGSDHVEWVEAQNNPEDPNGGSRKIPFSGELWIEREDFQENPPKDFFRLAPGREVRLRAGFFVTCTGVDKDAAGNITAVRCTYDPLTRGGNAPDGRKVKATIHWVSAAHALDAEVRLYEHLFTVTDPAAVDGGDFLKVLNPTSERIVRGKLEPSLKDAKAGERFQFERLAYFTCDGNDSKPGAPVFLRTVTLKDSYQKAQQKGGGKDAPKGPGKK